MGSYSKLTIQYVQFDSWKDGVDDSFMILFSEKDKRVEQIPMPPEHEHLLEEGETSPFFAVEYASTVEKLKKRLDFLGFTLDTACRVFELSKFQEIENLKDSIERFQKHSLAAEIREPIERYLRRIDLLTKSSADTWIRALREAFLAPPDADSAELSDLANSFRPVGAVPFGRFPDAFDDRFRLRFELEAFQTGEVVLDISDLVDGGCYSPSDPVSQFARDQVHARDREALHLIVLTEGSTDKFVLESALQILCPELDDYISFMDFSTLRIEGGASSLANMVRSFAAAGIRDRIVAIFDNDTAGCLSQSVLSKQTLADNIRVTRYPDIELAKNYPTLGPSGLVIMDVNGTAAGIELYLGRDVISEPDGSLIPIQWKGFEPGLRRYQGEILDKRGCLKRFSEKVKRFEQEGGDPNSHWWKELGSIIDVICSAFSAADAEFLIDIARADL